MRGFLWGVHPQRMSHSVMVGGVAAAATTGALIAMGHRQGDAGAAFTAIGSLFFPRSADAALIVAGLLVHVAAMFLWSALFVRLVGGMPSRVVFSAGVSAAAPFVVGWIVAAMSGRGLSSALTLGDRIGFVVVFALALVIGMRFAFSQSRNA
jgi:hypothetical protein